MTNLSRAVFDANMPPGPLWSPAENEGLDLLLDGIAEQKEVLCDSLKSLAYIRNADKTSLIDDLEKEYGISKNSALSDDDRISRLKIVEIDKTSDGTANFIEQQLQSAGFDIYVHRNDPPVDPNLFLYATYLTVCDHLESVCDVENAVCDAVLDDVIVNDNIYITNPKVLNLDSGYWPLVNFIGGEATRNTSGEITAIARADVPLNRRDEIRRLIVRYKPMHTWIGLVAQFI